MGVHADLLISSRWTITDVQDVLEHHLEAKRIRFSISKRRTSRCMGSLGFILPNGSGYMFYVWHGHYSPIGSCIYMHYPSSDEVVGLMRKIAEVLGGMVCPRDCDNNWEMYEGMLSDASNLMWFLKRAVTHNHLADDDDMEGLIESREKYLERCKRMRSRR